jgi:hypothetical protein
LLNVDPRQRLGAGANGSRGNFSAALCYPFTF